jgi:hypothetical protein
MSRATCQAVEGARSPSGIVCGAGLGAVSVELMADHLGRIGYRADPQPGDDRAVLLLKREDGRVVRRIRLWQQGPDTVGYAIEFAPIRYLQVLGIVVCTAAIALGALGYVVAAAWVLVISLLLLAGSEAVLAIARHSTREALEWAARVPTPAAPRRNHAEVGFPAPSPRDA